MNFKKLLCNLFRFLNFILLEPELLIRDINTHSVYLRSNRFSKHNYHFSTLGEFNVGFISSKYDKYDLEVLT